MTTKLMVLGAGSWGTALALSCCRVENQQVLLWGHKPEHITKLSADRENKAYLPNIIFPDHLVLTDDISEAYDCDAILLVVPSHAFKETLHQLAPYFAKQAIAWAIKGFDSSTNDLLSHTFMQQFPKRDFAVVAGPSFAKEVAQGLPTAITVAGNTSAYAKTYARFLHHSNMLTYTSDDMIGVQIGGALKNVIAIAAGISDGMGFGANTRTALITRGLSEINRIGLAFGARSETLMGLSGLGDLMLTCTDNLSRNRRFGLLLGQGYSVDKALDTIGQTVEGIYSAREAYHYVQKQEVRFSIINAVYAIITEKITVNDAMTQLLSHHIKPEND